MIEIAKILVPTDFSESSRKALDYALALAEPQKSEILLLHVVPPIAYAYDTGMVAANIAELEAGARDSAGRHVRELQAQAIGDKAPSRTMVRDGAPFVEIVRVARSHRCESMLLGLSHIERETVESRLDWLMSTVASDVVVLRAPARFQLANARRVLVPVGGRRDQSFLRARLLGSLSRSGERTITFLRVLPTGTPPQRFVRAQREMQVLARDEAPGAHDVVVVQAEDMTSELARRAGEHDLLVLGMQRESRRRKFLGDLAVQLAQATDCPLLLISRRG